MEKQPAIELSGLSVPLEARVPVVSAFAGKVPLLPKVNQRLRKPMQPVGKNSASAEAALAAEGAKYVLPPPGGAAKQGEKTCLEASLGTGVSSAPKPAATDSTKDSDSNDSSTTDVAAIDRISGATGEETEDEQISDSVAAVVEKMTGMKIDDKLLGALDKAVTRAMDKYEERAVENGELLIDVDALTKGTSDKVKITLPDTEPADESSEDDGNPEDDAARKAKIHLSVSDQVRGAVRAKLEAEMSGDALDKLAATLISSSNCKGAASLKLTREERKNCDLAQWVRSNWLKKDSADVAPAAAKPAAAQASKPSWAPPAVTKVAPAAAQPSPPADKKFVYAREL